jgi:hypothetical protein
MMPFGIVLVFGSCFLSCCFSSRLPRHYDPAYARARAPKRAEDEADGVVAEPAAPIAPFVVEQPKTAAAAAAPASKPAVAVKGKLILGGAKAKAAAAPQRVLTAEEERERVEREIEVGND